VPTVSIPYICRRREILLKIQNLATKVYTFFPPTDLLYVYALPSKILFRFLDVKAVLLILSKANRHAERKQLHSRSKSNVGNWNKNHNNAEMNQCNFRKHWGKSSKNLSFNSKNWKFVSPYWHQKTENLLHYICTISWRFMENSFRISYSAVTYFGNETVQWLFINSSEFVNSNEKSTNRTASLLSVLQIIPVKDEPYSIKLRVSAYE
jgi:hypothetical protein